MLVVYTPAPVFAALHCDIWLLPGESVVASVVEKWLLAVVEVQQMLPGFALVQLELQEKEAEAAELLGFLARLQMDWPRCYPGIANENAAEPALASLGCQRLVPRIQFGLLEGTMSPMARSHVALGRLQRRSSPWWEGVWRGTRTQLWDAAEWKAIAWSSDRPCAQNGSKLELGLVEIHCW